MPGPGHPPAGTPLSCERGRTLPCPLRPRYSEGRTWWGLGSRRGAWAGLRLGAPGRPPHVSPEEGALGSRAPTQEATAPCCRPPPPGRLLPASVRDPWAILLDLSVAQLTGPEILT